MSFWKLPRPFRLGGSLTLYGFAALVGVAAGSGAVGFEYISAFIVRVALEGGVGYSPSGPRGDLDLLGHVEPTTLSIWALLLVPAIGGLLAGGLCRWLAPEASGHGTDAVIEAYHEKGGKIRARVPLIKVVATALSLGTGGSGGREGPVAQVGAGIGSLLGSFEGVNERQRRILLAAGMGAGVGSIFRAPLAGALFAAEILYRDPEVESEVIIPAFISAAVAYVVYSGLMIVSGATDGFEHLFGLTGSYELHSLRELVPYTVLAVILVPVVLFYIWFFYGTHHVCQKLPGPRALIAALGGLLTGAVGLLAWKATDDVRAFSVLSYGYGMLQEALDGNLVGWDGARLLLIVALLKIVTTSLTISSGGSGGVFGPSMVIGGGLGGAVGVVFHQLGWVTNPGCFVVVGMTGFFAGAAKTPISTIIMVSEMTGSYELLLPAMWVCGITFIMTGRRTLYISQVIDRAHSAAHRGEYQVALLEEMRVQDVFEPEPVTTVSIGTPLARMLRIVAESKDDYFPVLDDDGRMVGIVSERDVREFLFEHAVHQIAIAADVMTTDPIRLTLDDDLHTALEKFNERKLDVLPVVARDDAQRLLGFLQRRAIGRAYEQKLRELEALRRRDGR